MFELRRLYRHLSGRAAFVGVVGVLLIVAIALYNSITVGAGVASSSNPIVVAQNLGCDAFKERLVSALKLYDIGPPSYRETETASWDIVGVGDVEASLRCNGNGHFVRFDVASRVSWNEKDNILSNLRTGLVMGAALRAYTDWSWKRALEMRDQMVKEAIAQRQNNGGLARVDADLTDAIATLGIVGGPMFTIESTESVSQ